MAQNGVCDRKVEGEKGIMSKPRNLEGQKFGRALVVSKAESKNGRRYWNCVCDCGNKFKTLAYHLTSGRTKSCGCYRHEREIEANTKHGKRSTRIYRIHHTMKGRCYDKNNPKYKNYGARGIYICDEWLGENGFINFYNWSMANGYKNDLTIERIDVNKNYCPENCTWIPMGEQAKNKTNNIIIEMNGKKQILSEWCKELNLKYSFVHNRIKQGWNVIDALTKPKEKTGLYEYKGKKYKIKQLSEMSGLSPKTIKSRLDKKWSINRIMNQPFKTRTIKEELL